MEQGQYEIVWTKLSQKQMKYLYDYISEDSVKNAAAVLSGIATAVNKAINNPEIYNADKYKINNDGSYRAFEKYHYRISYRFTKNVIRVLRVRHTSMKLKSY
jgi:plasmid stabilization system protein ParE